MSLISIKSNKLAMLLKLPPPTFSFQTLMHSGRTIIVVALKLYTPSVRASLSKND